MTAPLDLDAIEARVNAATEGPWEFGAFCDGVALYRASGAREIIIDAVRHGMDHASLRLRDFRPCVMRKAAEFGEKNASDRYRARTEHPDAIFIKHARTDVPALVARVRKLEAELAEARGA